MEVEENGGPPSRGPPYRWLIFGIASILLSVITVQVLNYWTLSHPLHLPQTRIGEPYCEVAVELHKVMQSSWSLRRGHVLWPTTLKNLINEERIVVETMNFVTLRVNKAIPATLGLYVQGVELAHNIAVIFMTAEYAKYLSSVVLAPIVPVKGLQATSGVVVIAYDPGKLMQTFCEGKVPYIVWNSRFDLTATVRQKPDTVDCGNHPNVQYMRLASKQGDVVNSVIVFCIGAKEHAKSMKTLVENHIRK